MPLPPDAYAAWPRALPAQNGLQRILHLPWEQSRTRTVQALAASAGNRCPRWAAQLASCCSSARLAFSANADRVALILLRCRHRLCPYCSRARTQTVASAITDLIRSWPQPRTIILTVASSADPLPQQIRRLRTWARALRRHPIWRANVRGGIYTLEITINQRTELWHPHLHHAYHGTYLPQKALQHAWHTITGGSKVVWIAAINNSRSTAMELAAYIGKPPDSQTWQPHQYRDFALATAGTRMLSAFGDVRMPALADHDPPPERPADEKEWSLAYLYTLYNAGSSTAANLLLHIALRWPYLGEYILQRTPQLAPEEPRPSRILKLLTAIERGNPRPSDEAPEPPTRAAVDAKLQSLCRKLLAEHTAQCYACLPAHDEDLE